MVIAVDDIIARCRSALLEHTPVLAVRDVLGDDVIHSVANSRRDFAVALHVYGGDFFSGARSEWDFGTYEERPRDFERTRRLFEDANARWRAER